MVNDRKRTQKQLNGSGSDRYTTEMGPTVVSKASVTQERSIDEFLSTAELADTDFTTERNRSVRIISHPNSAAQNPYLLSADEEKKVNELHQDNMDKLTVPRRPQWTNDMTAHELDRLEKEAFLDWRRGLAYLQEDKDLLMTPFERNIEMWRQLWRVVERSDLVVQIVDARNPLLFRSEDLVSYVTEVDSRKRNLLLINKSDLMTPEQRKSWADYFNDNGIQFAFFSAKSSLIEQEQQDEEEDDDDSEKDNADAEVEKDHSLLNNTNVLSVDQLEKLFLTAAPNEPLYNPEEGQLQIGLVGYPNVGKSSTINALVGAKKVSVSSTPGKTKHFQTIRLTDRVMLCDCPGLVFPNFATTKGELVCNGILPIDELREYTGPVELVTNRIPKFYLEALYGISIPTKPISEGGSGIPTAEELLTSYARARGYMRTGKGAPDESRAARYVLKDYVNAKLLYCHPPPTITDGQAFNSQLYNLKLLPESRQQQILSAIKSVRGVESLREEDIDTLDLSVELEKLKFSQHDPNAKALATDDMVSPESALIDNEFFASATGRERVLQPFHKKAVAGGSSKKHFKKNKKKLMALS